MTPIEQRFKAETSSYESLRSECNSRVVRLAYSTEEIWEVYPYCNRTADSLLPRPAGALYAWGYDAHGKLVVRKHFGSNMKSGVRIPNDEIIVEYFVRYTGDKVLISRFLRGRLQTIYTQTTAHGKIVEVETLRDDIGISRETFVYEGPLLKRSINFNDKGRATSETEWNGAGHRIRSYSVRRDGTLRPDDEPVPEGLTVKSLVETVRKRLLVAIPEMLAAAKIKEPVYALALAYDKEGDLLPPILGIGIESERQRWVQEKGKEAKWFVWNPAEWTHYEKSYTQLDDDELDEASDYLNQLLNEKMTSTPAKTVLNEVVAELAKMNWKGKVKTTPDFIIYAVDFELSDLNKNLKAVAGPEQIKRLQTKSS